MSLFRFDRRGPSRDDGARTRVEAWIRATAHLPSDVVVKVNEIQCPDPACPGLETIILIMAPGHRTRAVKVPKPAPEVTQSDVAAALSGEA